VRPRVGETFGKGVPTGLATVVGYKGSTKGYLDLSDEPLEGGYLGRCIVGRVMHSSS
jgi:hypothetical protein